MALSLPERFRGAMWGMYIGDALAMPVHWYYDTNQLRRDFGQITKYEAPKSSFRGSIMNLSNTGGGGRGSDKGDIIGDVILHDKKKYWLKGGNYHYHHGMQAGENTLDTLVARLLSQSLTTEGKFDCDKYLEKYTAYMTTPGTHNDTYAGTAHRMFFANFARGKNNRSCADNDGTIP